MKTDTTKLKSVKFHCSCKNSIECITHFAGAALKKSGWEKIGKQWYCGDCSVYSRKKSLIEREPTDREEEIYGGLA